MLTVTHLCENFSWCLKGFLWDDNELILTMTMLAKICSKILIKNEFLIIGRKVLSRKDQILSLVVKKRKTFTCWTNHVANLSSWSILTLILSKLLFHIRSYLSPLNWFILLAVIGSTSCITWDLTCCFILQSFQQGIEFPLVTSKIRPSRLSCFHFCFLN